MSPSQVTALINLSMLLALIGGIAVWWAIRFGGVRGRIAQRTREAASARTIVQQNTPDDDVEPGVWARLVVRIALFGDRIPLFDAKQRMKLRVDLTRAGFRGRNAVSVLVGIKTVFGILLAALSVTFGSQLPVLGQYPMLRGATMLGAFMIGLIVPEYVLAFRASRRRKALASYLPDALDLLVICTNAGNSLVVSFRRVADEMAVICPALSSEFGLTADELTLSGDSSRALHGLAERVDLPSARALISTLTQSMRFGTPITHALRTLSRTERLAHMVALEEKAAKLAPKMVLPMLTFILPAVCVIAAGPAVIQLLQFFDHQ
jgi:tight adherence protein C